MGDWYQVERSRLWSLPLSRYYFFQKKTQMFQIFGNLDIYENGFKCYWILKTIGYHLISLDWIEYMQAVLDCDQK